MYSVKNENFLHTFEFSDLLDAAVWNADIYLKKISVKMKGGKGVKLNNIWNYGI